MKVFILDIEHDKNKILIYGRDENNKKLCIEYNQDFFVYIIPNPQNFNEVLERIKGINYVYKYDILEKDYIGKKYKVIKAYLKEDDYDKIREFADLLKRNGLIIGKKEGDISIIKKFELENNLYPNNYYDLDLEYIKSDKYLDYYKFKKNNGLIENKYYNYKILTLDIETYSENALPDPNKDPIYVISLYNGDKYYTIYWGGNVRENGENYIKVNNERELLEKLNNLIKELDPDIIVGYNSHNFDIYYLYERAKKLNYQFNFSWDGEGIIITKKKEDKKYKFIGIQHLDLYEIIVNLFANQIKSETYTLNEIAKEILNDEKLDMDVEDINNAIKTKDFDDLIKYNRKDVELTYKLYKYFEGIIIELSKITGSTIYEIGNSTYGVLVENYLIKKAFENNSIIPNRPKPEEANMRKNITYSGAFVLEPKPGYYRNIIVFDFRSLYPSVIIAYNISPDTLMCEHEECKDNGINIEYLNVKKYVWFCKKKKGFIPEILEKLFEERSNLKKQLKQLKEGSEEYNIINNRQYALKILLNSMYGYMGFPNSRWYSLESAASVTSFGRNTIQNVIKYIENKGYKVIYGDTDSVFVLVDNKENGLKLLNEINENILRKPLELELEDFYVSGIFVGSRSKEGGAKKKYALLSENGKIKLRGFEAVRRDWSEITKDIQENVINYALKGEKDKIVSYLKDIINKIKNRELDIRYFIIKEQLRKDIKEYEVTAPHIVAAKKYQKLGYKVGKGFIVEYIICKGGEKVSDKVKLPFECKDREYDPDYYINKQIFPAIESILEVLSISKDNILSSQKNIFSFFSK